MTNNDWRADVLKFWFALDKEQWWRGTPELDEEIRRRFLDSVGGEEAAAGQFLP
jgi:uncharacterized protein (DUF924 family)